MRRNAEQHQPRAAAEFQHASWFVREYALDSVVYPFPHLHLRNRLAGVAAVPTADVESRLMDHLVLIKNFVVVNCSPLLELLGFESTV